MDSRLLILDDDADVARVIKLIAESAGLSAKCTSEPDQFFGELTSWQPTHIAIDLVMPKMDGVEIIGRLAERNCSARIIITSGLGGRILEAAGRSAGEHGLCIAGVLSKPFSPRALRELLRQVPGGEIPEAPRAKSAAAPSSHFEVTVEEMSRALRQRDFRLVYQPKIECASGRLTGFEALVRWMHPTAGLIMPDRFIPFAEAHDLIDALTGQVLDLSLAWLAERFGASSLTLAINMSARTVSSSSAQRGASQDAAEHGASEPSFVADVLDRCEHLGLEPSRLTFEVTESSAMEDPTASLDLLTRLRMKGINVAIDDFGTGYSSMLQLVRLPFSEIKVDKSFVITAVASAESRAVVKSVVDLGHSLGLQATAEGVEDAQTLQYLRDIGCDLAQGYYIARPMPAEAVGAWIGREASQFVRAPREASA